MQTAGVQVRRSADRPVSRVAGATTRSSFAFGPHYDPADTHLGPLVAHNEHELQPGHGFALHRHRDLEIVTWVLSGLLRHEDSTGQVELVGPGTVQWLSAGPGVEHAESCAAGAGATRFVQSWLTPDRDDARAYGRRDVSTQLAGGGLVPVAGRGTQLPAPRLPGAVLWVGRLRSDVALPEAALLHVYVASGRVQLETDAPDARPPTPDTGDEADTALARHPVLAAGDAARLVDMSGRLRVRTECEVLVWQLPGSP